MICTIQGIEHSHGVFIPKDGKNAGTSCKYDNYILHCTATPSSRNEYVGSLVFTFKVKAAAAEPLFAEYGGIDAALFQNVDIEYNRYGQIDNIYPVK